MKKTFLFIVTLLFVVTSASRAQPPVVDKYPEATIYIIDPQSGQEVLTQNDDAVLFKNAFIDLVNNTYRVKHLILSLILQFELVFQKQLLDPLGFLLLI